MINGYGTLVFWDSFEDLFGVLLVRKDELEVAVVNFFWAYEAWKKPFSVFESESFLSKDNDLRGEYLEAKHDILIELDGRLLIVLNWFWVSREINIDVGAIISVVKELLDSFLDDGDLLFVRSVKELLGHFGLDVQEGKVVGFKRRWEVLLFDCRLVLGIILVAHYVN